MMMEPFPGRVNAAGLDNRRVATRRAVEGGYRGETENISLDGRLVRVAVVDNYELRRIPRIVRHDLILMGADPNGGASSPRRSSRASSYASGGGECLDRQREDRLGQPQAVPGVQG